MSLLVSYEMTKPSALERQLNSVFDQRFEDNTLKRWKRKKWGAKLETQARLADATFALEDGCCRFTLEDASLEEAEPLRELLAKKKAKNLLDRVNPSNTLSQFMALTNLSDFL